MNKKIIIIIFAFIVVFLLIFFGISAYKYKQNDVFLKSNQTDQNQTSQTNIVLQNGGEIKNKGVQSIELLGSVASFNKDRKVIEIFSQELKKNIIASYSDKTTFYMDKSMSDEQYKQAIIDYQEKQKEAAEKMEKLIKENSSGGGAAFPVMPQQNFYQQVNDIEDLNIKNGDVLTVIGDYGGNLNKITALSIIKR